MSIVKVEEIRWNKVTAECLPEEEIPPKLQLNCSTQPNNTHWDSILLRNQILLNSPMKIGSQNGPVSFQQRFTFSLTTPHRSSFNSSSYQPHISLHKFDSEQRLGELEMNIFARQMFVDASEGVDLRIVVKVTTEQQWAHSSVSLTLCSTLVCWFLSKWTLISLDPSSFTRILLPTISAG